jgi:hypothetical protein
MGARTGMRAQGVPVPYREVLFPGFQADCKSVLDIEEVRQVRCFNCLTGWLACRGYVRFQFPDYDAQRIEHRSAHN